MRFSMGLVTRGMNVLIASDPRFSDGFSSEPVTRGSDGVLI